MSQSLNQGEIRLSAKWVTRGIAILVAFLAAAHSAVFIAKKAFALEPSEMHGLMGFFDMGSEANLPTFCSAAMLMFSAMLLALIASGSSAESKRMRLGWWILAAGFFLLSLDEVAQLHEGVVGELILNIDLFSGLPFYGWFLIYLPLLAVLTVVYLPFLKKLPRQTAVRFVLAGAVYLGGAIGVETFEGFIAKSMGDSANFGILAISRLIEETAEMAGVLLFIRALLIYAAERNIATQVSVTPPATQRAVRPIADSAASWKSAPAATPPQTAGVA